MVRSINNNRGDKSGSKSYGGRNSRDVRQSSRDRRYVSSGRNYMREKRSSGNFSRKNAEGKNGVKALQDDLCWGRNPVLTLLQERPGLCGKIYLLETIEDEDFKDTVARACIDNDIPLVFLERPELDELTLGANNQGVAAVIKPIPTAELEEIVSALPPEKPALVVIMDHCQDPHNLGAVIRTAEIAGAACVVCQRNRSATVNGTVVKTSAGAAFRLPVAQVTNVNRAIQLLKDKGFWVVGLDHRTDENIWDSHLPDRLALVVGAEGEGISALVAKNCDKLVKIPMVGRTGNLNASVAAAVGMFEWLRVNGKDFLQEKAEIKEAAD